MRSALGVGIVASLAACSFPKPADVVGDDDPPTDGPPSETGTTDTMPLIDMSASTVCLGTGGLFEYCYDRNTPPGNVTINPDSIDTGTDPRCDASFSALCVIVGQNVTVPPGVELVALGPRPLIIVATQRLEVSGTINVTSKFGGMPGAGANPSFCNVEVDAMASGGGAGGSFAAEGGQGGRANLGGVPSNPGSPSMSPHSRIRGGCVGRAGMSMAAQRESTGGNGGGAVHLLAASEIEIGGSIHAGGAGGGSCTMPSCGGAGGGSGGFIGLDAPTITVSAGRLVATGGGGGEGNGSAPNGNTGENSQITGLTPRGGSGGSSSGGDGGVGGTTTVGGSGMTGAAGGGAGGGGGGSTGAIATRGAVTLQGAVTIMPMFAPTP